MEKQDVLDAINATIVENGTKAITAQSLNNVLTMITENTGEGGSGEGALRVIVPDMMLLGPEIVAMGILSPASWEEMKSNFEQAIGADPSEYDAVVKASFEHNANVAQQILEKAKAGQGVSVVLDQTPYFPATINVALQVDPEMAEVVEDFAMCGVQPAGLFAHYIKPTPEGGSVFGGNVFSCILAPAGHIDLDEIANYPSNMLIILNLDGSLTFEVTEEEQPSSGSGVVTFYIPQILNNPTPEEISKNKASYDAYMNAIDKPIVRVCSNDGIAYMTAFSVEYYEGEGLMVSVMSVQEATTVGRYGVSSDGNFALVSIIQ